MPNKIDIDAVKARIEKLRGDYEAAWHAVWAEEARSVVRTILRHRRAGNRDAAKAVRRLLPERLEWRRWTGTLTDRDRRRIAEAEANAAAFDAAIRAGEIPDPQNTDLESVSKPPKVSSADERAGEGEEGHMHDRVSFPADA